MYLAYSILTSHLHADKIFVNHFIYNTLYHRCSQVGIHYFASCIHINEISMYHSQHEHNINCL